MATEDDSDVPETGAVFTFGKSRFADNAPSKFWIRNDKVVQVACGDEHTALVAESGRIFTFGANDWGQLGLGHNKPMTKPSCIKDVHDVTALKHEKSKKVACGRSTTFILTESGRLYACGANGENQLGLGPSDGQNVPRPEPIESLDGKNVTDISAGADHTAVLTDDGSVFIWGGGSEGQLGLGPDMTEVDTPIRLPMDEAVSCLSCGYYHTAVITESHRLYTFGETEFGKLGLGEDVEENDTPQEIKDLEGRPSNVVCGGKHTVVITESGRVYTFGDGANGQLGHGNMLLQVAEPTEIATLDGIRIRHASCGENHTALISDKGQVYAFGDGRHGKLGMGEENFTNLFRPSLCQRFAKFTVEQISCGGCHMLALAVPRLQNGDVESEESGEDEVDMTSHMMANVRLSHDFDLSGSISARNRRRDKLGDPNGTLTRTLPPLNSMSLKSLPPFHSTMPASGDNTTNPLNRQTLQPIHSQAAPQVSAAPRQPKPRLKSKPSSEEDSAVSVSEEDESEEDNKKRPVVKNHSEQQLNSTPQPKPRPLPRIQDKHANQASEEESNEDSEEESEDEEEVKKPLPKVKPVPVSRAKKSKISDSEEEEKVSDNDKKKKTAKKVTLKLSKKKESEEDSEASDDDGRKKEKRKGKKARSEEETEESEDDDKKKKKKTKEKDVKKKKKKGGGLFGRKKVVESEEEEESEVESDDNTKNKKKKEKGKKHPEKKRGKGRHSEEEEEEDVDDKKDQEKNKVAKGEHSDEDEENDEDKSKGKQEKHGKKGKTKKESDEEDAEEENDGDDIDGKSAEKNSSKNKKNKDKEKKAEEKKEEKKKSKFCTVL